MDTPGGPGDHIRSFKRRGTRVTAGQQRALDSLWERYGIPDGTDRLDPAVIFGRVGAVAVEVGFGMGETTAAMAAADPLTDLLAIDVHTPGVGALLAQIDARGLTNVRVSTDDAMLLLRDRIEPASLSEVRVFFPDPWPKARHHKRRLIDPPFAAIAACVLRPGGVLHCVTDWSPYAEQMLTVLTTDGSFLVDGFSPRPTTRPITRFERQGLAKGHAVLDIIAVRR